MGLVSIADDYQNWELVGTFRNVAIPQLTLFLPCWRIQNPLDRFVLPQLTVLDRTLDMPILGTFHRLYKNGSSHWVSKK